MAKTPKVKKREVSFHSRAARRGASPPSKDLTAKAPVEEPDYKPWLHNAQNAGITKKKKSKQLTRQQRLRQERTLEHAERNIDKLEKKVANSKHRSKKVRARAAEWDELNDRILGKENVGEKKKTSEFVGEAQEEEDAAKNIEDVELPDIVQPLPTRAMETAVEVQQPIPVQTRPAVDDLDEVT